MVSLYQHNNSGQQNLDDWFDFPEIYLENDHEAFDKFEDFEAKHDPSFSKQIIDGINKEIDLMYNHHGYFDYENLLDVLLAFLKMDEKSYMENIERVKEYKGMLDAYSKILGLLISFFCFGYYDDLLGQVYQDRIIGKFFAQETGTFYTPFNVALLMSKLVGADSGTIHDPACGTGVMFITTRYNVHLEQGWRKASRLKFYGQDINSRAVKMCQIQLLMTNHEYMASMLYMRAHEAKDIIDSKRCEKGICGDVTCSIHPRRD